MQRSRVDILTTLIKYIILGFSLSLVFIPFFWLISTSIKLPIDIFAVPQIWIPTNITFEHYQSLMQVSGIFPYFINSIIIASTTTLIATLLGASAAYSLAKVKFPFKLGAIIIYWILLTRMYPAVCTGIGYFLVIKTLGLLDTRMALIITYTGFNIPFVVWILIGFFNEIPLELEEAAVVDGATLWQRFSKIVLPISIPGIVVAAVFSFILAWNEFLFSVILTTLKAKTIPVVISGFITDRGLQWGQMSALGIIAVIPVIGFALLIQKNFVRGLTFGAVKG